MLFMISIGGSTKKSNVEVHDILFISAPTFESTYEIIRKAWYGTKESLHIDSYKVLKEIDGYNVELSKTKSLLKMYFVVYGGHEEYDFTESHKLEFVVAKSIIEAKEIAQEQIKSSDKMNHVDSVCDVQKVLLGERKQIILTKSNSLFREKPDWFGYIPLK